MLKKIIAFSLFILFVSSAAFAAQGIKIDNFRLKDLQGKEVSLEQFRGKVVVLNFWATWCPPCRAEMPEFDNMGKEFQKSGDATLLAVNITDGRRDTRSRVEKFIKDNAYSMTVLLDNEQELAEYFHIRYIPTTVVIDGEGCLVGMIQGGTTRSAVMELVESAKK